MWYPWFWINRRVNPQKKRNTTYKKYWNDQWKCSCNTFRFMGNSLVCPNSRAWKSQWKSPNKNFRENFSIEKLTVSSSLKYFLWVRNSCNNCSVTRFVKDPNRRVTRIRGRPVEPVRYFMSYSLCNKVYVKVNPKLGFLTYNWRHR